MTRQRNTHPWDGILSTGKEDAHWLCSSPCKVLLKAFFSWKDVTCSFRGQRPFCKTTQRVLIPLWRPSERHTVSQREDLCQWQPSLFGFAVNPSLLKEIHGVWDSWDSKGTAGQGFSPALRDGRQGGLSSVDSELMDNDQVNHISVIMASLKCIWALSSSSSHHFSRTPPPGYLFSSLKSLSRHTHWIDLISPFLAVSGPSLLFFSFSGYLIRNSPRFPWPWQTVSRLSSGADKGNDIKEITVILMKSQLPKRVVSYWLWKEMSLNVVSSSEVLCWDV